MLNQVHINRFIYKHKATVKTLPFHGMCVFMS